MTVRLNSYSNGSHVGVLAALGGATSAFMLCETLHLIT